MVPESLWGHGTRKLQGDKWYRRARRDKQSVPVRIVKQVLPQGDKLYRKTRGTNSTGELVGTWYQKTPEGQMVPESSGGQMVPESLWGHGTRKLQGDKWSHSLIVS